MDFIGATTANQLRQTHTIQ